MKAASLPPSYVNIPVAMAYADVDDALIVTMTRILGLCWTYDYERTPALAPEQLAELTGRPRSTLYRHLKQLRELRWIRVDQASRRIIIRPIIAWNVQSKETPAAGTATPADTEVPNEALLQALADIGVENPKRAQLARLDIDPVWVRAWHRWAKHPHRQGLSNPVGNVILKLESREQPPGEFLREAEEHARLEQWMREQEQGHEEDDWEEEQPDPERNSVPDEAHQLWAQCLGELQLQMTRATFDTWLRGSKVVDADEGCLTIAVRHDYAVDWLQNRLLPVVQGTLDRRAGGETKIVFVAGV